MNYAQALAIAERAKEQRAPYTDRICIVGSIRRQQPVCKDLEVDPGFVSYGLWVLATNREEVVPNA